MIAGLVVLAAAALSRSSSPPHNLPNEPRAGAATEPKGVVPTANTASNSESDCKQSLSCWAEKHTVAASIYCRRVVERLAAHDFEWTDGFLEPKFSHYRWSNQTCTSVTSHRAATSCSMCEAAPAAFPGDQPSTQILPLTLNGFSVVP